MATSKYSDIEIQTAKNLLKEGYKWLKANPVGTIVAYEIKPIKNPTKYVPGKIVCTACVPIFKNVTWKDDEPTSLESIVHPPILDDAERRYLSAVIRPFRNKVEYIEKVDVACEEYIHIQLNKDWAFLPHFRTGTMYKGMKPNHGYTLEELGL